LICYIDTGLLLYRTSEFYSRVLRLLIDMPGLGFLRGFYDIYPLSTYVCLGVKGPTTHTQYILNTTLKIFRVTFYLLGADAHIRLTHRSRYPLIIPFPPSITKSSLSPLVIFDQSKNSEKTLNWANTRQKPKFTTKRQNITKCGHRFRTHLTFVFAKPYLSEHVMLGCRLPGMMAVTRSLSMY